MTLTLDIIGLSAFGKDFNTLHNSDDQLASVYRELFEPTPDFIRYFIACIVLPDWLGRIIPMTGNRKLTTYSARLHELCREIIIDKKAALQQTGPGRTNIVSVLLKNDDLSDDDILDQMLTFLAAGYVVNNLGQKQY